MIRAAGLILPGVAFASWLGVGVTVAGGLVEFPNVSEQAPKLTGYLARPDASLAALAGRQFDRGGPYPAVVVLHGCAGISSHSTGIADRLGSWGYVTLAVDSLSPRGISSACRGGVLSQAFDAYAALRYLTTLEDVDPARVAVLGQSMGGGSALYALDRDLGAQYFTERFRAAILYYPGCGIPGANNGANADPDRRQGRLDPGRSLPRHGHPRSVGRLADHPPRLPRRPSRLRRRAIAAWHPQPPRPLAPIQRAGGARCGNEGAGISRDAFGDCRSGRADLKVRTTRGAPNVS